MSVLFLGAEFFVERAHFQATILVNVGPEELDLAREDSRSAVLLRELSAHSSA
jgi:hypothetical protein